MQNYLEINRRLWDAKTPVHMTSDFYDLSAFKTGKDSLNSIEIDLLGDISGKRILHLQCHFGMDTLSLSRRGAAVTGVDLSPVAIAEARKLAEEMGQEVRFIESDVYQLADVLDEQFDMIFTSYGVLGWLPDMNRWAAVVEHFLKPNGTLLLVEFHPVVWMLDDNFEHIHYSYFNVTPFIEETEGTYADPDAPLKDASVSWNHSLGDVLGSLTAKKMEIVHFSEYDYSPYDCFPNTTKVEENKFQFAGLAGKIPMVYALKAINKS